MTLVLAQATGQPAYYEFTYLLRGYSPLRAAVRPADQQRVLLAEGPDERLLLLEVLLTEESDYLAARLQMG